MGTRATTCAAVFCIFARAAGSYGTVDWGVFSAETALLNSKCGRTLFIHTGTSESSVSQTLNPEP